MFLLLLFQSESRHPVEFRILVLQLIILLRQVLLLIRELLRSLNGIRGGVLGHCQMLLSKRQRSLRIDELWTGLREYTAELL